MKFHAGDFSLDNAPWTGRPVEVHSDQIETLPKNNQCHAPWEIPGVLKISKSIATGISVTQVKVTVVSKNENCVLFYRKKLTDFLGNPILS